MKKYLASFQIYENFHFIFFSILITKFNIMNISMNLMNIENNIQHYGKIIINLTLHFVICVLQEILFPTFFISFCQLKLNMGLCFVIYDKTNKMIMTEKTLIHKRKFVNFIF